MTPDAGQAANSPRDIPARGWKEIVLRTWKEASSDNIGLIAAGVAFYSFLALVPLIGATVLTYGLVADVKTVGEHIGKLMAVLPKDVGPLVAEQLANVVRTSGEKKGFGLLLAIAVALFGARNAAGSIVTALNVAYEEDERRSFIAVNALALGITLGGVVTAALGMVGIGAMRFMRVALPQAGTGVVSLSKVLTYLVLGLVAATAAALLYRYGPAREHARWRWLTPGSLVFAAGWVLLTLVFGFYAARFGDYGATYGSLSAVVVLLTWIYLSAYALLFGAELNSEIEHQTARDTTCGPARPLGERGAWAADHVAGGAEGKPPQLAAPS